MAIVAIMAKMAIMAIMAMANVISNVAMMGTQLKSTKKLAQWCWVHPNRINPYKVINIFMISSNIRLYSNSKKADI